MDWGGGKGELADGLIEGGEKKWMVDRPWGDGLGRGKGELDDGLGMGEEWINGGWIGYGGMDGGGREHWMMD